MKKITIITTKINKNEKSKKSETKSITKSSTNSSHKKTTTFQINRIITTRSIALKQHTTNNAIACAIDNDSQFPETNNVTAESYHL